MVRSILPALFFSAMCMLAMWLGMEAFGKPVEWQFWFIAGYFSVITIVLLIWQERSTTDIKSFIRRFMAGLVIKLLLSLFLLFVLLRTLAHPQTKAFVVVFALLYLAFLAFSTGRLSLLLRKLRQRS